MTLPDAAFWRGRRVLITGHTGFKGGWLALWLTRMGATVTGYGLGPEYDGGIYSVAGLNEQITPVFADIRHSSVLRECLHLMRPQVVIHLAGMAQGAKAARDPAEAYEVNVLGTVRLLEELRRCRSVRAAVIATSGTVYENDNAGFAFSEGARLGGATAHAAGKAAVELAVAAFRSTAPRVNVATVRTGNVIGGGDWGEGRLMGDAMRAFSAGTPLAVRAPESVRSWQYVLDALGGYLLLAQRLLAGDPDAATAWNFGPAENGYLSVGEIADQLTDLWNDDPWGETKASWTAAGGAEGADVLKLDSSKARSELGWKPRLSVEDALAAAVRWHQAQSRGDDMAELSRTMIENFLAAKPS